MNCDRHTTNIMSQDRRVICQLLLLGLTCWIVGGRPDVGVHTQVLGEWHTTSWESCEPEKVFQPVNDSSGLVIKPTIGLQRRTLTCISANASVLPPSRCGDTSKPMSQPQQQRRCIVAQPCRVADWSQWEIRQQGCRGDDDQVVPEIQIRHRRIIEAPIVPVTIRTLGSSRWLPEDGCPPWEEKLFIDQPSQLPLCNQRYKWQPSPWSTCRANSPITSTVRADAGPDGPSAASGPSLSSQLSQICGGGIQMRSLTCLRLSDSRPVNSALCRALTLLPTIQHCEIPCDSDCQVGEWSPWSPCMAARCINNGHQPSPPVPAAIIRVAKGIAAENRYRTNDEGHSEYISGGEKMDDNVASGYQFRHRRILSNASADGTECPALSQLRRCHTEWGDACSRWEVQPLLDTCHLASNATCGLGYHELVFRCRRYDGVTVDDDECSNNTLAPLEQVACTVQCSSDCVLSPWSEWTPCIHQGRRRRTRYVVGLPQPDSQPCTNQLMEEQLCSVEQQMEQVRWPIFGWWPLPWGPCQMIDGSASSCGAGTHTREVRCTRDDGQHVDDSHCALLSRPESVRICSVSCPEECRLSDWSEWSQCSDQSKDDAIQSRIRVVLQQPASAASSSLSPSFTCPPLMEKRSCFDWLVQQERIGWQVSAWSPCHLPTNAKCGTGISIRSVYCHDGNNATMDPSVCLARLMDEYRQLETYRECHVACQRDANSTASSACQHEHVMETRSLCPRNCIGTRSISGGKKIDCDEDGHGNGIEKTSIEDCPCERVTLELEDWSACLMEEDHARSCGRGKQFRRRKCIVTATGQLAPLHWCNEEDFETRSCDVACPIDCQLSSWSSWTNCNSTCGPGSQQRHRKIEMEPANGGRPCGSTEEIQACNVHSCDTYQWRTSDWTPCHLAFDRRCGDGLQTRYVRCIHVPEDMVVEDAICDKAKKPRAEQPCQIACPGHCVISSWSAWSPCQHCHGERRRERSIIRNPVYNHTCLPLEEIEYCSNPASGGCFTYDWQVSEWSSCQPLGGSNCGEGVRTRIASCVRNDGYVTDSSNCDSHTRPGLTEMWCHVECPIDCQVSQWSAWDDSECAPCGHHSGLRSRHREIQMINNQFGRSCPTSLRQQLPCPYQPCYEWRPSNWSGCYLQGAHCGMGARHQLFECILAETGKRVDPEFCRLSRRPPPAHMTECKVLCTFEKLVKASAENSVTKDSVSSIFPSSIDDDISVLYYPNDGEFNIWMVAMIAIGSLFLVFVGVTIFLICSSREESNSCKRNMSVAGAPSEFRTRVHRVSNGSH